ncbi:hypothetical protein ABIE45_004572 [Methylobacterium sp. OAE515]
MAEILAYAVFVPAFIVGSIVLLPQPFIAKDR